VSTLPEAVELGGSVGGLVVELTRDHKYRTKALNIPGAFYDRESKAYVVVNPQPRTAAAIIALFPQALVDYPELTAIRDSAYENARPYDFASELGIRLDVGPLGDKSLYDWQDTDAGYLNAIMARDGGAFVGWDRGLGKTIVTAAFIIKTGARRSLVVARNDSKESVWLSELGGHYDRDGKWVKGFLEGTHDLFVLPNVKKKREAMLDMIERNDGTKKPFVLIIHYEAIALIAGTKVVNHRDDDVTVTKGGGSGWDRLGHWFMAFDEGHRLASYNPNSRHHTQMGRALSRLRRLNVDMALNLTGSSIMNRADDLFGQLHYLFPKVYRAKWRDWNDRYVDYIDDGNRKVAIGFKIDELPRLRRELGVFMVYRTKDEVFDLPPLIEQPIELDLYPEQRRVYDDMRDQFWAALEEGGINAANPLAQMNLLRRIATYYPGVKSAKLDFALHELEEEPDEQFVIFTWYKDPGRALAERLGDDVVVVDGDVPIRHRAELLRRHERGQARVLVGSIATLGESLNLQYMHEAIRLDRDWNPQVNQQTRDRLYRNGQQARVTFRDLWSKNTVDTLSVRPNLASKESLRKAVFG
jgi:SNF2 family DNA or RNA helicase